MAKKATHFTLLAHGLVRARFLVQRLVEHSAWFEFEPRPDDVYAITAKTENFARMQRWSEEFDRPGQPIRLHKGHKANFATLQRANDNGDLCLVSAIRIADKAPVALVCAMGHENGVFFPSPLAVMIEGNPFELFEDPTAAGPDAEADTYSGDDDADDET